MAKVSTADTLNLRRIRRAIDEDRVDFRSFQCPRCGEVGGLEVIQQGDGPEARFNPCQHRFVGDVAEAYLVKAFPGKQV